ncbi:MAG: hypothetical protein H0X24_03240 [Ktedonobacterales bacterium]|nr:hypothetical protein [Ktedonobacterales bacterium]
MSLRDQEDATFRLPVTLPRRQASETTQRLPSAQQFQEPTRNVARQTLIKVPEITLFFWVIKLLTTALGEATSDYLVHRLDPIIAVALGGIAFASALALQLLVRRYVAGVYWLAVVMVALFGTMAADVVHIVLGVPYAISTVAFALALAGIFAVWYRTEGTLSIHSIFTPRREWFYWATIIATFALGTAAGDMTAYTFGLGYLPSAVLFIALFAIPAVGYWLFGLNAIVAFWIAYILTRPIGASFADWTGKAHSAGGLGIGAGKVSLLLAAVIISLVGYLTITRRDVQPHS